MKKLLITCVLAIALSNVFGQTEQSDLMVGGSVGFSFEKTASASSTSSSASYDEVSSTTFSFSPNIGYFVVDGLALGLDASYATITHEDDYKQTEYSIAPFLRYYMGKGQVKMFVHGEYGLLRLKAEPIGSYSSNNPIYKGSIFLVGVGAATFLSKNIALEAKMMYYNKVVEHHSVPKGMFFSLGFQIHLSNN
jgi:hypothetical protein